MHPVIGYVIAAALFAIGCYGVLVRRNAILVLMAVELLLAAVTLLFVTADVSFGAKDHTGQAAALFVIVLAAAEVGVGLAIILRLYRARGGIPDAIDVDTIDSGAQR